MEDDVDRVVKALTDVIAIEQQAPDMVRVITVSEAHIVDTRYERCTCSDMMYNLQGEGRCKHLWRALLETSQLPLDPIFGLDDNL